MAAVIQKHAFAVAVFALAILCSPASSASLESSTPDAVWLDDLPHGFIANPYGPPRARLSFGRTPLRIAGRAFDRGIGTHAPARTELNLDGRATRFTAFVGVDQAVRYRTNLGTWDHKKGAPPYVYDGSDDRTAARGASGARSHFRGDRAEPNW